MTAEDIIESLKEEIKSQLGFPAFLLPQKATNNTARIELLFQDLKDDGDDSETLVFSAEYRTNGTHLKWLTETIRLIRKLKPIEKAHMSVTDAKLRAYWIRNGIAQWVYPSEDESSMGSEYVIPYRIEIDIPTRLLED